MTNQEFDELISMSVKNYAMEYFDTDENMYEEHEFSKKFERKMRRLIRRQKYFYFPSSGISPRRITSTAFSLIILISAAAVSVSAAVYAVRGFIVDKYDDHSDVEIIDYEGAPETIEDVYGIDVPEGFEVVDELEMNENSVMVSVYYEKDDKYIHFIQIIKSEYDFRVNTENDELYPFNIDGHEGYILECGIDMIISWIDDEYAFMINSNIGKNALINIAKTVHKVE